MTRCDVADFFAAECRLMELAQQTQLPPDYIDLEKRVDALKQVHQKMLGVTYV